MARWGKCVRKPGRERGAFLVFMGVLLVVIVGVGALAIDLGRVFVLRSEMQNAADAAAIAGAMELDNGPNAVNRARTAALNMLEHNSKFTELRALLGDANQGSISFQFYCSISSKYDPTSTEIDEFCTNPYDADGKSLVSSDPAVADLEARYIRVTLQPSDNYSVSLSFLPSFNASMDGVQSQVSLGATALAGRTFYMCNFPPMAICNPFEPAAFSATMSEGDQIRLRYGTWSPGNFGFLQPDNTPGGGAMEASDYLADETLTGCRAPVLTTETGSMSGPISAALNTRFDKYSNPGYGKASTPGEFPPAPNVISFPKDNVIISDDTLNFGDGSWDRTTYWTTYHQNQGHLQPSGYSSMSRFEVYTWELDSGLLPSKLPLAVPNNDDTTYDGIPDPNHVSPSGSISERRVFPVAVVNCSAHNITGMTTFRVVNPEGFARIFLTQSVEGTSTPDIYGEYIEWAGEDDADFHTDVQLYE